VGVVTAFATAAAVLIGVAVYESRKLRTDPGAQPVAAVGWGWAKPDALPQDLPAAEYLRRLADAAEEWTKKRPADAIALAQRLNEFRQGCAVLILSEHRPLAQPDREWLKERCQKWAGRLNEELTRLESGTPVAQVEEETTGIARQIAAALRERAQKV
jgi:hypothetical protein